MAALRISGRTPPTRGPVFARVSDTRSYDVCMVRRILALALSVATLSVAGCVAGSVEVPDAGPLAIYRAGDGGMDALLDGTLELQGACIVITDGDGTAVVPVFPAGDATWDGDSLSWRGNKYQPGDAIAVGGGGRSNNAISAQHYIPDDCGMLERWLVTPR